jgi:hypothetical protein
MSLPLGVDASILLQRIIAFQAARKQHRFYAAQAVTRHNISLGIIAYTRSMLFVKGFSGIIMQEKRQAAPDAFLA